MRHVLLIGLVAAAACTSKPGSPDRPTFESSPTEGAPILQYGVYGGVTVDSVRTTSLDSAIAGDTTKFVRSFRLVVTTTGVDSQWIRVKAPAVSESRTFGPHGLRASVTGIAPFGFTAQGQRDPATLFSNLRWAAANKVKLVLALTAGGHSQKNPGAFLRRQCPGYVASCRPIDSTLMFSRQAWDSVHKAFDSQPVRDSLAKYRQWIAAFNLIDEPNVTGEGDGNTWGPRGTLTKARVDSLCAVIKSYMPGIPALVAHQWSTFDTTHTYRVCDGFISQYSARAGPVAIYHQNARRFAARGDGDVMYSINWINGGTQDLDGTWDCKDQGGWKGTTQPNCRMTPFQVKNSLLYFGARSCGGQLMWEYDSAEVDRYRSTLVAVADSLRKLPARPCTRR